MTRGRNKPRTRIMNTRVMQAADRPDRAAARTSDYCKHGRARWRFCMPCNLEDNAGPRGWRGARWRFYAKTRRTN